ncbi:sulfotransferase domain-containing protein [Adhaeribacter radiodurans]|uniref:Sulfotransferase domain-containing protein n=1 Tax=Adhaeribacter radiodurans TaxID=2745197 RepID=A0A7L7L2S6_9BACT|nr:sulfotransferase domain-containing protein [Adhaeribacter radiodurans]QMU27102.1 sulfotransferase domain-containing protein [Adhaeribacter radiodurans]
MQKLRQDFGERDTDIYVVTYPKSGTTLMQMLLYQMTTDGNMDFEHLYKVSPWCRFSAYFNQPMPSVGQRRIIKTHDPYQMLGGIQKGKFIFVLRDGLDVIASLHQHLLDYNNPQSDFSDLANRKMRDWFEYNKNWLENKAKLNILYLHYEDVITNKEQVIQTIATFLEIEMSEPLMERVLQKTSFDFMKKHETKFGEQPEPNKVYNNFIRNGKSGEGKQKFTEDQIIQYKSLSQEYQTESTLLERYFE